MEQEPEFNSYRTSIDSEETSVSIAVIRSVAAVTNRDVHEMDPLYDVIDPDALDELFAPSRLASRDDDLLVEFSFNGCSVRITGDCDLWVMPNVR